MYLVQILLPLYSRDAKPFSRALFDRVELELSERFGGMTSYARAPARGLWEDAAGHTELDDLVVLEVMAQALDQRWWAEYRAALETRFAQDELIVRALEMQRL